MDPELVEMLKANYPKKTALIKYRGQDGKVYRWPVGAIATIDSEKTFREHLKKWIPGAEFLGWAVQ